MRDCDRDPTQADHNDEAADLPDTVVALARVGLDRLPPDSEIEVQGAVRVRAGTYVAWSPDAQSDVTRARTLRAAFTSIELEAAHLRFVEPGGSRAYVVAESIHLRCESALVIDANVRELVLLCSKLTVEPGAWIRWDPALGSRHAPKLTIQADEVHGALPTVALRGADGGDGGSVDLLVTGEAQQRLQDGPEAERNRLDLRPGTRLLTPYGRPGDEATQHAAAGRITVIDRPPQPSVVAPRAVVLPAAMAIGDSFYVIAANVANESRVEIERLEGGVAVWTALAQPLAAGTSLKQFVLPSRGPDARGGSARLRIVDTRTGWKSQPSRFTIVPRLDSITNYGAQLGFGRTTPAPRELPYWTAYRSLLPSTWIAMTGDGFADAAVAEVLAIDGTVVRTLPCNGDGMFVAAQLPGWDDPLAAGDYRIRLRNPDGRSSAAIAFSATSRIKLRMRLWKLARAADDDMSDAYLAMLHDAGKAESPVNYWALFGIDVTLDTRLTRALVPADLVGDWPTPGHALYATSLAHLSTPAHFDPDALNVYLAQRISNQNYGWTYDDSATAPPGNNLPSRTFVVAKAEEILDLVGQRGDQTRFTTLHEMGHALGLPHWCARGNEDPTATTSGRKCGSGDDDHLMRAGFRLSYTPNLTAGELAIVRDRARWFHER